MCVKKKLLHWALEAHVHKTTYGPINDMALYIMQANPLLGQVGGGWALETLTFLNNNNNNNNNLYSPSATIACIRRMMKTVL